MLEQVPGAFLAGLVSIVFPCVLPLVPGYLSAISALEADRLGEPGMWRRVTWATLPFIAGFTVVFVLLGTAAAALGGAIDDKRLQNEVAGFVLVVIGLGFVGLLPWPERAVAPGLTQRARRRGSSALLGGAFAVCAAPCIGVVLGSVLVLAAKADTALRGAFLLAVYSAGLGLPFLASAVAFNATTRAFAVVKRHYAAIQLGAGVILLGMGVLVLTGELFRLNIEVQQFLDQYGLNFFKSV